MAQSIAIEEVIAHNKDFVDKGKASLFPADKRPRKHMAVVTCMDTRLVGMLSEALGLVAGDANIIKVAGAQVDGLYGSVMRSLLVAVYELGVTDILVVAHTDCGAQHMSFPGMSSQMEQAGIDEAAFTDAAIRGIDLAAWLKGFGDTEASIRKSVGLIKGHPFIPATVSVQGFIIDTQTGQLQQVE